MSTFKEEEGGVNTIIGALDSISKSMGDLMSKSREILSEMESSEHPS